MLRINAIKININTTKGLYGFDTTFDEKLNIVRGDNSSGKSTLFQSILYGLGMEELIGGRNDKAMQSVLKNEILNHEKVVEAEVIESSIYLEIKNQDTITIERYVKSETKKSQLVQVYYGALLTGENKQISSDPMYLHDAGSATDIKFGFFAFLEKFLGITLPEVQYNDGSVRKIYLQTIFPGFVIEQKVGWSDFLATIPFYNIRDKEKRAVEFILKLDSWRIEERKQELVRMRQDVEGKWNNVLTKIKELARRAATELKGLDNKPFIINDKSTIYLQYSNQDATYTLAEYISLLFQEVKDIESKEIPNIQDIAKEKEIELGVLSDKYNVGLVQQSDLENRKNTTISNIQTIKDRLSQIDEELTHNKHHLKVKKLGADNNISIASDHCPTCGQDINDSLLSSGTIQIPMNIEQNIGYLEAQKSMAKIYLENHKNELDSIDLQLKIISGQLSIIREKTRAIKKDLISDDRLPSIEIIEQRIRLKNRLDFYVTVDSDFDNLIDEILAVSEEWQNVLSEQEKIPKESFSKDDYSKLKFLNDDFVRLLREFDYGSKSLNDLSISKDKLIPVAEGQYNIKYNMRLDSSASDLVRAIAAYTCSLYSVSEKYSTNHPGLIMLDEPGTQETAISSLRKLFLQLQSYNAQSIVFASFKQSDNDFQETTNGINFKLIRSSGKKFIVKK
ncbi:MAG: AAA family ATPase [Chitinophagaceae bacterium]|jgi:hypothetical protein|nr:AAA family ATPase [Chitinophagaceae bacterium]